MKKIQVPGAYYSLFLAFADWLLSYLSGNGASIPWSAAAIATIPIIVKIWQVYTAPIEDVQLTRSLDKVLMTKTERFLWG